MVDNFIERKLLNLNELFVLFCVSTKAPFLICNKETFDDEIYVFINEEDASDFLKEFSDNKFSLRLFKVPNERIKGFLSSLYMYGVDTIVLYIGAESNPVSLDQISKKPDITKLLNDKVPRINPDLQITTLYFLQDARRKIERTDQEKKTLLEKEEEMAVNIFRSRFIIALDITGINKKFNPGDRNQKFKLITLTTHDGSLFIPCFSDLNEFTKFSTVNKRGKFHLLAVPYNKLKDFCKGAKGIVINPTGFNLLLRNEAIERLNNLYA